MSKHGLRTPVSSRTTELLPCWNCRQDKLDAWAVVREFLGIGVLGLLVAVVGAWSQAVAGDMLHTRSAVGARYLKHPLLLLLLLRFDLVGVKKLVYPLQLE